MSPTWEEPYRRLIAALDTDARLNVVGRLMCRHDALRHLCARLTVLDAHRRDPALAATAVPAPVFITGPARSGTSILQELLALDPNLRAPLAYEMAHPVVGPDVDDDTRAGWAECEFDLWGDVDPGFRAVHDLDARLPEECLWLMAPQFDIGFWSTNVDMPEWMMYRAVMDPTPVYDFHKRFVQVLQGGTPTTWLFKSPVHLSRLGSLMAVYPDARIIRTHRDPVKTVASTVSTLAHGRYTRSDEVDTRSIAASSTFGLTMILNGIAAPEAALPEGQVAELQYLDLMADPVGAVDAGLRRARAADGARAAGAHDRLPGRPPQGPPRRPPVLAGRLRPRRGHRAGRLPALHRRLPGPLRDLSRRRAQPVASGGGGGVHDEAAVAGEGAVDEPGGARAGEAGPLPGDLGEAVAPLGQAGLDHEGRGLEVVAVVAGRAAEVVPGPVDGRGRAAERRGPEGEGALDERQRLDDLADARDPGPAADHAEGHVGAEAGGGLEVGEPGPPQHRGGVGRPAAEAGAGGDALLEPHVGRAPGEGEGPAHEVVVGGLDGEAGAGGGVDQLEAVAGARPRGCRPGRG